MIVVFDASSLISMGQSCLIKLLGQLQQDGKNSFVVPESVYFEGVERPMQIKRFELNAMRLKNAVDKGWLKVEKLDPKHFKLAKEIEEKANRMMLINGKPVRLIQRGEIDALALTKQLGSKLLVIDERTTRTIIENPSRLKMIIERRRDKRVSMNNENAKGLREMFKELVIVRSVELIALAFERKLLDGELPQSKQALEAALYALKYAGCAVGRREIENFLAAK